MALARFQINYVAMEFDFVPVLVLAVALSVVIKYCRACF